MSVGVINDSGPERSRGLLNAVLVAWFLAAPAGGRPVAPPVRLPAGTAVAGEPVGLEVDEHAGDPRVGQRLQGLGRQVGRELDDRERRLDVDLAEVLP